MGNLDILLGQYEPAQAFLEESRGLLQEVGDYWRLAFTLRRLGRVARLQGGYEQAARFYIESLHLARTSDWRQTLAWCLVGLAELAALREQSHKAVRLLGAAKAMPELYSDFGLAERLELEQMSGTIRAQLDEATFTAGQAAGRQMTLDEAIAYALSG
jgi:tetratricopeptide (TPR) repeat protein